MQRTVPTAETQLAQTQRASLADTHPPISHRLSSWFSAEIPNNLGRCNDPETRNALLTNLVSPYIKKGYGNCSYSSSQDAFFKTDSMSHSWEEIILTKGTEPVTKIVSIPESKNTRTLGGVREIVKYISSDFDGSLDEFHDALS